MTSPGVRIPAGPRQADGGPAAALRRRPRQSRALATSDALQEAFVRVLLERGYARTTVREVAAVAGVGIGTFYGYFGNMKALAAICIHRAVSQAASEAREAVGAAAGRPLRDVADALLDSQTRSVLGQPRRWAALFMLERQVSPPEAFQRHYAQWVDLWSDALGTACDRPEPDRLRSVARMTHAISYGWLSQCLLTSGPEVDAAWLRLELGVAVQAYLARCSVQTLQTPQVKPG